MDNMGKYLPVINSVLCCQIVKLIYSRHLMKIRVSLLLAISYVLPVLMNYLNSGMFSKEICL